MVWSALIPAGLSAGASLLGGFLGRKSQKRQAARQRKWFVQDREHNEAREDSRLQRLVKDAQAAGYNPLTALRGGAPAGTAMTHMPALSTDVFANAVAGAGNALATGIQAMFDYDPLDEDRAQLELDLMRAQTRQINQETMRIAGAPTASGSRYQSGGGYADGRLGETSHPEIGRTSVTNPHNPSSGWRVNPDYLDAQAFEDRYGDIVQQFAGVRNAIADFQYNQGFRLDDRSSPVFRSGRSTNDAARRLNPTVERGQGYFGLPSWDQLRRFNRRARINDIYRTVHGW